MAFNKNSSVNVEQVAEFLKGTLSRIEKSSENDIQALTEITKAFKKSVPLSKRKYVTAFLIQNAAGRFSRFNRNDRNTYNERREHRFERTERPAGEQKERAPRVQIDPAVAQTIFISIGKNRRVSARDFVGLLCGVAGLERDRIGDIRILANYSFVTLFAEDSEKAIASLNGYEYRGRKLNVSYSQKKEEKAENEVAEKPAVAAEDDVIPANVTNESSGITTTSQEADYAQAQSAFAASMAKEKKEEPETPAAPYFETADDGQVRSHFGDGAVYN